MGEKYPRTEDQDLAEGRRLKPIVKKCKRLTWETLLSKLV